MKYPTTKELAVGSIQRNMLAAYVDGVVCRVMLANGKELAIICNTGDDARRVHISLLYLPLIGENNARQMEFKFKLQLN